MGLKEENEKLIGEVSSLLEENRELKVILSDIESSITEIELPILQIKLLAKRLAIKV